MTSSRPPLLAAAWRLSRDYVGYWTVVADTPHIQFGQIPSTEADRAFQFHISIAARDEHIWPRSSSQIHALAEGGFLFGARRLDTGEFVALCYALFSEDPNQWELGGLTVAPDFQKQGIGSLLAKLTLVHTIAFNAVFENGHEVISHVHAENEDPRSLLKKLGFSYKTTRKYPATSAPRSMKRDAEGFLVGDEFVFTNAGLCILADWLDGFEGSSGRPGQEFYLDLGSFVRLADLRRATRSIANEFGDCSQRSEPESRP